jgi:hypothetical protein
MNSFAAGSSLLLGFELSEPAAPEMDWFIAASALIEAVVAWKNLLILLLLMGLTVLGAIDPDVVTAAPPPFIGLVGAAGFCTGSTVTRIPFAVGRLLKPDRLSRNSCTFSRALKLDAAKLLLMVVVEPLPSDPAPKAAPSLVDKLLSPVRSRSLT